MPTPAANPPAARALTPRRLRRLTNAEMENVYADLLGGERLPLGRGFLPDPASEGFDNDAVLLGMGTSKAEEVVTAAERVAAALVAPCVARAAGALPRRRRRPRLCPRLRHPGSRAGLGPPADRSRSWAAWSRCS